MNRALRRAGIGSLAILSLALAGCAGASDAAETGGLTELSGDEQVEIVFESYNLANAGIWSDTITTLLDAFMEEHPNITVVAQPSDSSAAGGTAGSVQKQLLAGAAPDVAQLTFNELDFAATTLGAQNLTELVGQQALDENFGGEYPYHERAEVLADWEGSTYGIPYVFSTPVLWINEAIFEQAGVDPATADLSTWESVTEVGQQISAVTGEPSVSVSCVTTGGNWCMQGVFLSGGAQVLSDDRSTIEFGSDAAVETIEVFREMYDAGVLANQDVTTAYEAFAQGKTALHVNTSALQGMFMGGSESGGWTLSATTLPAFGSKPVVPTNSGSFLSIFATDPAKQAASWELIKWMTSPTAYEAISTGIGYLPLRNTMADEGGPLYEWVQSNPLVEPNLKQLDVLEPWTSYPGDSYAQVDTLLATAIEESIFYGGDAATLLPEAAARAQELIE